MTSMANIERRLRAVEERAGTGASDQNIKAICLVGVRPAESKGKSPVKSGRMCVLWVAPDLSARYGYSSTMTRNELDAALAGA